MRLTYGLTSTLVSVWLLTAGCGGQTSETDEKTEDGTRLDDATEADAPGNDSAKDDAPNEGDEPGSNSSAEGTEDDVADATGDDATGSDDVIDVTGTDFADDTPTDDGDGNDIAEPTGPRTSPPVDLLFVIDNSRFMEPKQALLALAIPELVERLLAPVCVDELGNLTPPGPDAECVAGSQPEFTPIADLHVGVITTSLGGYGAQFDCAGNASFNADALQEVDMAELLGSLPRGAAVSPSSASSGFLSWTPATDTASTVTELTDLVRSAGEFGCGFEAPLEAWYRFLVEPFPYTKIVRLACNSNDTYSSCAGPELAPGTDAPLVNVRILQQRKAFLRPDSVLAVIMFGDENDCSFSLTGQTWRLAQSAIGDDSGAVNYYPAFRGTAACNNPEMGPNHECCHSCGQATVAADCPTMLDSMGQPVAVGCEVSRKFTIDELGDHPNLRCFEQKRRFGVDYLYPVERYSQALLAQQVCPQTDAVTGECTTEPVPNPLYADLNVDPDSNATPKPPRATEDIFLVGVLGVPWQDLVVDPSADSPKYRVARKDADEAERVNWDWILGPRQTESAIPAPLDPLMKESVQPREGIVPSTGESVAAPGAAFGANSSNGHEYNINDESQLQYACTFPIPERTCPSLEDATTRRQAGESVMPCQCTDTPGDEWANPLCQAPDGSFDDVQRAAGAFPGLRQLQVLYDVGDHAVVTSICPWNVDAESGGNYGYRPAMNALVERLRERLQ